MRAKKSLGQNFLRSKTVVNAIINTAGVSSDDTVLEIGPGKGILTKALLEKGARVIAVEKDGELTACLEREFSGYISEGKLALVNKDILEIDLSVFDLNPRKYKLIANIPYYITGQIIRFFLEHDIQPKTMTLMVQKEVAERIVARGGKESILSISVKAYGNPRYIQKVPARYFKPAPKVDSAIMHINNISKSVFDQNNISETDFFRLVRAGFSNKRKYLLSNIGNHLKIPALPQVFEACSISANTRAEDISVSDWVCLAQQINVK